jgi:4-aminobutyrate aminotransferase-like enzyme
MAAGLAVLAAYDAEGVLDNVRTRATQIESTLTDLRARHPSIGEVRGTGLLWMVDLVDAQGGPLEPAATERLRATAEEHGVLFSTSHESYIGLWPPLVLGESDCAHILSVLDACLTDLER